MFWTVLCIPLLCLLLCLLIAGIAARLCRVLSPRTATPKQHVTVLVIGDVGRSPRTMNHALSFAEMHNVTVSLVGFVPKNTGVPDDIANHHQICLWNLPIFDVSGYFHLPFMIYVPCRVIFEGASLLLVLLRIWFDCARTGILWRGVLIQNPPMVPAIIWVQLVRTLAGWFLNHVAGVRDSDAFHVVVDFHNFGHTILAQKLGEGHIMTCALRSAEIFAARRCVNAAFTVTKAMQAVLCDTAGKWRLGDMLCPVSVLYDLPTQRALSLSADVHNDVDHFVAAGDFFSRLARQGYLPGLETWNRQASEEVRGRIANGAWSLALSRYRKLPGGMECFAERRCRTNIERVPRITTIVSCTSWTPDEDFGLLLDVLELLADRLAGGHEKLAIFITGRGTLRADFEAKLQKLDLKGAIVVSFLWLSHEDYPELLRFCDWGLSLHQSSSGLDLPMKVVDMYSFGKMPVVARHFPTLEKELVVPGTHGYLFTDSNSLLNALTDVAVQPLDGYEDQERVYRRMQANVSGWTKESWESSWKKTVWDGVYEKAELKSA